MKHFKSKDEVSFWVCFHGGSTNAALSFTGGPWMVRDSRTSSVFQVLIRAVHGFRMPLFFVLRGFFTAMLWLVAVAAESEAASRLATVFTVLR